MAVEYKTASPLNSGLPFGAWLNSQCVDGWRLQFESKDQGFIFEREKPVAKIPSPKASPKVTRKTKVKPE